MSRDFDARVRDLHEAPLDFRSVKGKARKIRRNRRAAVAGGILGVAAIIAPIAVLANDGNTKSEEQPFVEDPTTVVGSTNPEYLLDGTWVQADGDRFELPDTDQPYQSAVIWDGNLVATRWDGEVFNTAVVIAENGTVLATFDTTGHVVVDDTGETATWVAPDGDVIVSPEVGEEVVIDKVDLAAPGEATAWLAAAISGGPDCLESAEGCTVYLNSNLGAESRAYSSLGGSDVVTPGATKVFDATDDGLVSAITKVEDDLDTCGGIYDAVNGELRWDTCDYQVQQMSPGGEHVAAPQSQYDAHGPTSLAILDSATGEETGRYGAEGGFIHDWAWSTSGDLLFTAYDGANWHLFSMTPAGEITEVADPVEASDVDNPFTLIRH